MLTLRPTTAADLPRVVALEATPDTASWLCGIGQPWHERALADADQEHLVAEADGVVRGFVVLAGLRDGAGVIEVRRMALHPDSRGAGRGRALLQAAVARAHERHSVRGVWLDVKAHNQRAKALYESEGFVHTKTLAAAVTEADGTKSDLLIMARPSS